MKKSQTNTGVNAGNWANATRNSMCSSWGLDGTNFTWDNRWGVPLEADAAGAFTGDDVSNPPKPAVFLQARRWTRMNPFVQRVQALRRGFLLHGLLGLLEVPKNLKGKKVELEYEWHPGIRAVEAKDRDALLEWKQKNAAEIQRVVVELTQERQITRNAVAVWMPNGRVLFYPAEKCSYRDLLGQEELTLFLNLTAEYIQKMNISEAAKRELLASPKRVVLTASSLAFKFRVLKDESVGMGFGWPDLAALFHYCALEESLVVGDRQLADACRLVYEQHKLGHEIKSGPHAGSPAHFANKTRREGTIKEAKSAKGHKLMVTNFDHEIVLGAGRPNPNQYDALRYKAVAEHLAIWGAPYAQMWAGIINPFLMQLAKMDCAPERQKLQSFLPDVIRKGMRCPVDVAIQFDDSCFWDSRMLLDVLKTGLAGGPVSQGTFLRQTGLRQSEELERKQFEADLPEALTKPAYDAAHGPPDAKGKPAGKNDKS